MAGHKTDYILVGANTLNYLPDYPPLPELLFSLDGKTAKTHDFGGTMRDVEVDKTGAMYVVTFRDIFKSSDHGATWKPLGKTGICIELGGCGQ